MFQFAGGKDNDITAARFLPSWWFEDEGTEPGQQSREALMAKFEKTFRSVGGRPSDGS